MIITKEWLKENDACIDVHNWFLNQNKDFKDIELIETLIQEEKYFWAIWTIIKIFNKIQRAKCAIFAAEQVLHIFEYELSTNYECRDYIKKAKNHLNSINTVIPYYSDFYTSFNHYYPKIKSEGSCTSAYCSAYSAYRIDVYSAYKCAVHSYATYAADNATNNAYIVYDASKKEMQIRILNYGIKLLKEEK
jgi:hypothetical protein